MLEWHSNIQSTHIQPRRAPPNNPALITSLSDTILVLLATNIAALISYNINRDKILADVDDIKKDKFRFWPEDKKQMLSNRMIRDRRNPVNKPPKVFTKIINHKIVRRVKQELDTLLSLDGCICNVSLKFTVLLQSGDFIVLESDEPGKLSIFFLEISKLSAVIEDISL